MPELPEVEAVCRRLRAVEGRRIVCVTVNRCATPRVRRGLSGRRVERVERRGKHILLRLDGGRTLHVHLRMSGNLYRADPPRCREEARVRLELDDGSEVVLEDGRALARMDLVRSDVLDARLTREMGIEPLSSEFSAAWLIEKGKKSRKQAKVFLMDQRAVAGLGNIYAAEALHRARVHPCKPMQTLGRKKLGALHSAIVAVLRDAVQSAWIAYSGPGKWSEAETFPLEVYGREGEPCRFCARAIRRIVQGGRSTYFCPGCQR